MPLMRGFRLGPYEILSLLGSGGMGEVYRARDTKLRREVALKILPEVFAADPERLARFRREAQVLATLNHPNIAAIYGVEDSGPLHALVLELVEGPTLAERLQFVASDFSRSPAEAGRHVQRGRGLPIEEALPIARQIADAMEAAHEKGIVHRDLKPANIKITPAGVVKVLDFGLATALTSDAAGTGLSQSPTVTVGRTREGVILGTPAYMSPEQARGQPVDKRTDVWAFACVFYEMLSGRAAFARDTISDTVAAVLEREPEWSVVPAATPPSITRALQRCLVKDPKRRLHDIADMRIEIEDALAVPAAAQPSKGHARWQHGLRWAALVAIVMAAAIAGWSLNRLQRAVPGPVGQPARFTIQFPSDAPMVGSVGGLQIALSPDGALVAYVARPVEGGNRLYLRQLDQLESRLIPGSDGAVDPFFSPDGQWIGFFAGEKLMKVARAGGLPQTICEVGPLATPSGASWSPNNTVLFSPKAGAGLWRVSSAGGTPTAVTDLKDKEINHVWPEVLPNGNAVLFNVMTGTGEPQIYVQSLETGVRRALEAGVGAHYLPSGHVVYARGDSLFALPFDLRRLEATGTPVRVVGNVLTRGGVPQVAFSRAGSFVFIPTTPLPRTLVWVERTGEEQPLQMATHSYFQPRLAPDERRLAVMIVGDDFSPDLQEVGADVWLWDFSRENLSRLTLGGGHNYLLWTPDGRRVSFLSGSGGPASGGRGTISWKRVDDSNSKEEPLLSGDVVGPPLSWSPDGRVLAFVYLHPVNRQDIWTVRLEDKAQARPFVQTRFAEGGPAFSPDGRWLAYVSDESGRSEVYVQPFPGPGEKFLISTGGGYEPVWPRRGRELFYRNDNAMMVVDVTTGTTFRAGKPRRLFEGRYARSTAVWSNYDVTSDGQRFLMVKSVEEFTSPTQINVVLNWFEELKAKVPAGK